MGGHALTPGLTRRYDADEYQQLVPDVLGKLARSLQPGNPRLAVIPSLRRKPSFGDMDVLVERNGLPHDWVERIQREFKPSERVKNGSVLSFDYQALQIDVILASAEEFAWSHAYFSWGDTGNLVGRVAHRMGLKYGHDGLWLPYRHGDYLLRELLVTREIDAAMGFLGFDYQRWILGFDTQEEVFRFIADGRFFDPSIYAMENRTARDRVRDRKRAMYSDFLAWAAIHAQARFDAWPVDKRVWLPAVFNAFPIARVEYARAEVDLARQMAVRAKFDGDRIGKATGMRGKDLGVLMRAIRASFTDQERFEAFMLGATDSEVDGLALRIMEESSHEQV